MTERIFWKVRAEYVLGGWTREVTDNTALFDTINEGVQRSPLASVTVQLVTR